MLCDNGTNTQANNKNLKQYNKTMEKDNWAIINELCVQICDMNSDFENMISDTFDAIENGPEEEIEKMGIPFLRRVFARIKSGHELGEINAVVKMEYDGEPCYRIKNYDYPTFKWAHKIGLGNMIDCRGIYILRSALSDSAIAIMERKIKS